MDNTNQLNQLRDVIANTKVHVSFASYTKVTETWKQLNFVPDFNRFYYICEGEGGLEIDGQRFSPEPGQWFVMPSGIRQSYYTISDNTFGKYWCHFTSRIGGMDLFQMLGLPYYIDVEDQARLSQLFRMLIKYYKSTEFTAGLMVKATMMEMISLYLKSAIEKEGLSKQNQTFKLKKILIVIHYIEQHLHENITVKDLADILHFHPNYFIRYFRDMTGTSPIQYVQQLKMERAQSLLTMSEATISDIADRVGMELYYFSRQFKKQYGLSPTEYRQSLQSSLSARQ